MSVCIILLIPLLPNQITDQKTGNGFGTNNYRLKQISDKHVTRAVAKL